MSEDRPQVYFTVVLPHLASKMDDPDVQAYIETVDKTTQTLALLYAAVLARPSVLLGLFNRILKTTAEMFKDELEQAEEKE